MCFFGGGGGAPGPQSSADKASGGYVPKQPVVNKAVQNQNTADRNTIRRADSYGSQKAASSASASTTTAKTSNATAVQGGMATMNALNDYNKNKKTKLGS
tara:strand:+ start:258 stop:557 length:300 start_codon:yes stop_codon:yes gene_type:complete